MTLFDTHYEYIKASAEVFALDTARALGMPDAADDLRQELLLFLWERVEQFDPKRGKPSTFIAMCLRYGQKTLLRHFSRQKRRINLMPYRPDYPDEPEAKEEQLDLLEFISLLPEAEREICTRAYNGENLRLLAAELGCGVDDLRRRLAADLMPYALETGWVRGTGAGVEGVGTTDPEKAIYPGGSSAAGSMSFF